ncbi:hypothetical protein CsatB_028753 [Cannabis sativa]
MMSWSEGCVRNSSVSCDTKEKDVLLGFSGLKVPDSQYIQLSKSVNQDECKAKCLSNCSCMAYSYTESDEGSDCVLWFGDLFDIRQLSSDGQTVYIRIPFSTKVPKMNHEKARSDHKKVVILVAVTVGLAGVFISIAFYILRRRHFNERNKSQDDDLELPFFDLHTISVATDNFSEANKLGEGGFGPVYKRLLMCSGQGADEFKNEIKLIAKLQHRNLVKIFGYCIHREMKLLVYEYMPNKSLDYFIFDERQNRLLDWPKRFQIVCGIAKGLLYLHHDLRLRIIHRDLRASNVLLDEEMNPKISDFGLARAFGGDQIEGINTNKVAGTYGYMAPEYAFNGLFSTKLDVFSFGTLMLEILSGKKSRDLYDKDSILNLIGLAWILMKEGNTFKLIDKCL